MSLTEPYDGDNIFAKILRGDIPCAKIAETTHTLAFMDAFPQSRGHALVIPKAKGATNLLTAPSELLPPLMVEVQRIGKAIDQALRPDGIRIAQFNGAPAGQTVFHLHLHIIPTYEGETIGAHGSGMADFDDLQSLAAAIAAKL